MAILLAFAPFIAFALIDRLVGPLTGLIVGGLAASVLLLRDWITPGHSPKILEIGTVILFWGLTVYTLLADANLSVIGVRLCVDTGLLLIVLVSMAIGRPFTLQYAHEQVAPEFWDHPKFVRTNYIITAGWAVAFATLVIAEAALLYVPGMPPRAGIVAIILALVGAVKFTGWYPEHMKAAARKP